MKPFTLVLATSLFTCLIAHAQGPLTPPGAPAPTMKTLTQVEPRTPIESLPYTISGPGSYYFTKNLEFSAASGNAITINSGNVTLDLNGFTLSSTAGVTGAAISCDLNISNIEIKNGMIAGNTAVTVSGTPPVWNKNLSGFSTGVYALADRQRNFLISHLQVSGCRIFGIYVGYSSISYSTVSSNGNTGILADNGSITNSTASRNGNDGIHAEFGSVTNSTAETNGYNGIAITAGSVSSSTGRGNGNEGIEAYDSSVINSTGSFNSSVGIVATYGSVINSVAYSNDQSGIWAVSGTVTNCTANDNLGAVHYGPNGGDAGIYALYGTVTNCTANSNKGHGIMATEGKVADSVAGFNDHNGIYADHGGVINCMALENGWNGIGAVGGTVANSTSRKNLYYGIHVGDNSTVTGCTARNNNLSSTDDIFDLNAPNSVVMGCSYGSSYVVGSAFTGNKAP